MSPPRSCSVCADGAPSREAGSPVPGLRPVVSVDTRETSGWLRSLLVSRFLHLERELKTLAPASWAHASWRRLAALGPGTCTCSCCHSAACLQQAVWWL